MKDVSAVGFRRFRAEDLARPHMAGLVAIACKLEINRLDRYEM